VNLNGRDEVIERARRRFDAVLAEEGKGICIASLPLLAEEIAGEEAGGVPVVEAEIVSLLRQRAGRVPEGKNGRVADA